MLQVILQALDDGGGGSLCSFFIISLFVLMEEVVEGKYRRQEGHPREDHRAH